MEHPSVFTFECSTILWSVRYRIANWWTPFRFHWKLWVPSDSVGIHRTALDFSRFHWITFDSTLEIAHSRKVFHMVPENFGFQSLEVLRLFTPATCTAVLRISRRSWDELYFKWKLRKECASASKTLRWTMRTWCNRESGRRSSRVRLHQKPLHCKL